MSDQRRRRRPPAEHNYYVPEAPDRQKPPRKKHHKKNQGKKRLKVWQIVLIVFFGLALMGTIIEMFDSEATKDLKASIAYFEKTALKEIPSLAEKKDQEGMIAKLQEIIPKYDEYVQKYIVWMNDENLTEGEREAAMQMKTAFYGIKSTCLEPLLAVMQGTGTTAPEYSTLVNNCMDTQIKWAREALQ